MLRERSSHLFLICFPLAAGCVFFLSYAAQAAVWQNQGLDWRGETLIDLVAAPADDAVIVLTSSRLWQYDFSTGGFNALSSSLPPGAPLRVASLNDKGDGWIVMTRSGVYQFLPEAAAWKKVFVSSDENNTVPTAWAQAKQEAYCGTRQGLFRRKNDESTWSRVPGALSRAPIVELCAASQGLWAATPRSLYFIDESGEISRRLTVSGSGAETNGFVADEEKTASFTAPFEAAGIKDVLCGHGRPFDIVVAARNGLWLSRDQGKHWSQKAWKGLAGDRIVEVIFAPATHKPFGSAASLLKNGESEHDDLLLSSLVAATPREVYAFREDSWHPLRWGLDSGRVAGVAAVGRALFCATERGLFLHQDDVVSPARQEGYDGRGGRRSSQQKAGFDEEPSIRQVQLWAMDYAEVHPEKIQKWRKQARWKALLPTLSAGIDRAATDLYHWDTGASPDNLLKGRDYLDWDVSVSWDLGDVIWSTDQTTIDSRSKLMVELRENILDQVTRLYFERRRLQINLQRNKEESLEVRELYQLQIDELTALIDAFTGGRFSQALASRRSRN